MEVHTPLIAILVMGLVLAFVLGAAAKALRLSPLVGYLLAGIAIGPFTPGFVPDAGLGAELAEVGIVLLMFGLGLEVSLRDLLRVRVIALLGALGLVALAGALGLGLALTLGWRIEAGLVLGLALSVTSGVALLGSLKARGLVATEAGRIATGWLVVENAVMVLALVLLPALAGFSGAAVQGHDPFASLLARLTGAEPGALWLAGLALVKLVAFAGFMLVVGRLVIPFALDLAARLGARELFRLGVFAIALGVALGVSALFNVPIGLGAFLAGMTLAESPPSRRAAEEGLPLREAFPVLFFIALGMLFDPAAALADPLPLLAALAIVLLVRPAIAYGVLLLARRGRDTAGAVATSLGQIGEFSFILAAMAVGLGLLPPDGRDLILAVMVLSIVLNPLARLVLARPTRGEDGGEDAAGPSDHAVLVGHGLVGEAVAAGLRTRGLSVLVIEDREPAAEAARARGLKTVSGNAADPKTLERAGIGAARILALAMSDGFAAGQTVRAARRRNPALTILARAHSETERAHLIALGADHVVAGAEEIARALLDGVEAPPPGAAETAAAALAAAAFAPAAEPEIDTEPRPILRAPSPVIAPEAPAVELFPASDTAPPAEDAEVHESAAETEAQKGGPGPEHAPDAAAPIVAHAEAAVEREAPPVLPETPAPVVEGATGRAEPEEVSTEPVQSAEEAEAAASEAAPVLDQTSRGSGEVPAPVVEAGTGEAGPEEVSARPLLPQGEAELAEAADAPTSGMGAEAQENGTGSEHVPGAAPEPLVTPGETAADAQVPPVLLETPPGSGEAPTPVVGGTAPEEASGEADAPTGPEETAGGDEDSPPGSRG